MLPEALCSFILTGFCFVLTSTGCEYWTTSCFAYLASRSSSISFNCSLTLELYEAFCLFVGEASFGRPCMLQAF